MSRPAEYIARRDWSRPVCVVARTTIARFGAIALVAVGCRGSASDLERCHEVITQRQNMVFPRDPALVGDGKILLQLLRCNRDRDDVRVVDWMLDEIRLLCAPDSEALLDNVSIETMYPSEILHLADEAGCGELRHRGQTIYVHPSVVRFRLEHRDLTPSAP